MRPSRLFNRCRDHPITPGEEQLRHLSISWAGVSEHTPWKSRKCLHFSYQHGNLTPSKGSGSAIMDVGTGNFIGTSIFLIGLHSPLVRWMKDGPRSSDSNQQFGPQTEWRIICCVIHYPS